MEAGFGRELEFLENVSRKRKRDAGFPLFHKHPLVNRPSPVSDGCKFCFIFVWVSFLRPIFSLEADIAADGSVYDDGAVVSISQD